MLLLSRQRWLVALGLVQEYLHGPRRSRFSVLAVGLVVKVLSSIQWEVELRTSFEELQGTPIGERETPENPPRLIAEFLLVELKEFAKFCATREELKQVGKFVLESKLLGYLFERLTDESSIECHNLIKARCSQVTILKTCPLIEILERRRGVRGSERTHPVLEPLLGLTYRSSTGRIANMMRRYVPFLANEIGADAYASVGFLNRESARHRERIFIGACGQTNQWFGSPYHLLPFAFLGRRALIERQWRVLSSDAYLFARQKASKTRYKGSASEYIEQVISPTTLMRRLGVTAGANQVIEILTEAIAPADDLEATQCLQFVFSINYRRYQELGDGFTSLIAKFVSKCFTEFQKGDFQSFKQRCLMLRTRFPQAADIKCHRDKIAFDADVDDLAKICLIPLNYLGDLISEEEMLRQLEKKGDTVIADIVTALSLLAEELCKIDEELGSKANQLCDLIPKHPQFTERLANAEALAKATAELRRKRAEQEARYVDMGPKFCADNLGVTFTLKEGLGPGSKIMLGDKVMLVSLRGKEGKQVNIYYLNDDGVLKSSFLNCSKAFARFDNGEWIR